MENLYMVKAIGKDNKSREVPPSAKAHSAIPCLSILALIVGEITFSP
jgi:hypothetical protein